MLPSGSMALAVFELAAREGPLRQRLTTAATTHVSTVISTTLPPDLRARLEALQHRLATSEAVLPHEGRIEATIRNMGRKELAAVAEEVVALCLAIVRDEASQSTGPRRPWT